MTARFKDFGSGSGKKYEPLSFALYGETFNAKPAIQGKVLIDFAKESSGDPAAAAGLLPKFFAQVLQKESNTRFNALLESDKIVEVETLAEIVEFLMEAYTNRPEEPAGA